MQTEMIDKLFLELSQVTTATTAKELAIFEKLKALREAVEPFASIVYNSDGRIPTEQLSLSHWHKLTNAFYAANNSTDAATDKFFNDRHDARVSAGNQSLLSD